MHGQERWLRWPKRTIWIMPKDLKHIKASVFVKFNRFNCNSCAYGLHTRSQDFDTYYENETTSYAWLIGL